MSGPEGDLADHIAETAEANGVPYDEGGCYAVAEALIEEVLFQVDLALKEPGLLLTRHGPPAPERRPAYLGQPHRHWPLTPGHRPVGGPRA